MGAFGPNGPYLSNSLALSRRQRNARRRCALPSPAEPAPVGASVEHARQDSNLQPPVLETGALPIELRAYSSGQGQN